MSENEFLSIYAWVISVIDLLRDENYEIFHGWKKIFLQDSPQEKANSFSGNILGECLWGVTYKGTLEEVDLSSQVKNKNRPEGYYLCFAYCVVSMDGREKNLYIYIL